MNKLFILLILLSSFIYSQDSTKHLLINLPSGINVNLSGKIEFEYVDVEGKGGSLNNDNNLNQEVQTRSPFLRIDKAVLKFKAIYTKYLSLRFGLRFNDSNAYLDRIYLLYQNPNHRLEIGRNKPAIALSRKIEAYPLIGTAFWRGRQYHIDYEKQLSFFKIGSSLSLKRPLSFKAPLEDNSFPMLVYGNMPKSNKDWDGVTTELGIRGEFGIGPLSILGWGYWGKLYDDYDWKLLYDQFTYYREEQGEVSAKNANRDHYWMGIRSELDLSYFFTRGEYVFSKDGFLDRNGFYIEIRKLFNPLFLSKKPVLFLARYGGLNIEPNGNWEAELNSPHTWNRSLLTIAAVYNYTEHLKIKFEYYIAGEKTGDKKEIAELDNNGEGRIYQPNISDNQLLIQFDLTF